jgi:hypothetical protein
MTELIFRWHNMAMSVQTTTAEDTQLKKQEKQQEKQKRDTSTICLVLPGFLGSDSQCNVAMRPNRVRPYYVTNIIVGVLRVLLHTEYRSVLDRIIKYPVKIQSLSPMKVIMWILLRLKFCRISGS